MRPRFEDLRTKQHKLRGGVGAGRAHPVHRRHDGCRTLVVIVQFVAIIYANAETSGDYCTGQPCCDLLVVRMKEEYFLVHGIRVTPTF